MGERADNETGAGGTTRTGGRLAYLKLRKPGNKPAGDDVNMTINWWVVSFVVAIVLAPALLIGGGVWAFGKALIDDPAMKACAPATVTAPARDSFALNVLNASESAGAASRVAKELPLRGFKVGAAANDTTLRKVSGAGQIRFGPQGLDQAVVVKQLLMPDATFIKDRRTDNSVDLVLGPSFTALPEPEQPLVFRDDVTVNVYNTTYFLNLATPASEVLASRGFHPAKVGIDAKKSWITEVATVRHGPDGLAHAKLVQAQIPDAQLLLDPTTKGTTVDLLIGMKWRGIPAADTAQTPAKRPALPQLTITRPCL